MAQYRVDAILSADRPCSFRILLDPCDIEVIEARRREARLINRRGIEGRTCLLSDRS